MINLHIARNTLRNDSRVLKEAGTLRDAGMFDEVRLIGLNEPGLPTQETLDGLDVRRVNLSMRGLSKGLLGQVVKFAEWQHRIVSSQRNAPLSVIHCHDLDPLPLAVRLKALTGARLVYDAHELETEQGETSRLRVALARLTERRLIRHADAVITVSDSIAAWYREAYPGVHPALVRNVPVRAPRRVARVDLRGRFGVPDNALLFIYLGALSPGRGIEELLDAFQSRGVKHHLVLMGYGPLTALIGERARMCSRLHLHDAVAPATVLDYAAGADVGVSMILDTCLSYRYCLPNKLFEYALAGLPVLASDLPEQRSFIEKYDVGWVTSTDVASIVQALGRIDHAACAGVRAGLADRTAGLGWHVEADTLVKVYRGLPAPGPGGASA